MSDVKQDYLTAREVADLVRVSEPTVYRWALGDETMPALRVGRPCDFRASDSTAGCALASRDGGERARRPGGERRAELFVAPPLRRRLSPLPGAHRAIVILADFLARLDGVRPEGDQHVARCPGHRDRRPSLVVGERAGKLLVHCRSRGCRPEDIVRPLGLTLADLFVDSRPRGISRKPESALNVARREIIAAARRQPWARPGVLALYQLVDWLRLADAAPVSEASALRMTALATFEAQMGAAIASEFEVALQDLALALGGVAA